MEKMWKKVIALALCLCTVLGLMLPVAGSADAADAAGETSVLDQYKDENGLYRGPLTDLGIALHGDMGFSDQSELLDYNGEQYLLAPAEGGILFVFRLSEFLRGDGQSSENWIYDQVEIGGHFRSIVCDSHGKAYISNGGDNIYVYDISKKNAEGTTPLDTIYLGKDVGVRYIAIDENNNLYVTTGSCKVFQISYNTPREITELCDLSDDLVDMAGIIYGGGHVYATGNKDSKSGISGSYIYKLDPFVTSAVYERRTLCSAEGGFTYLSYAGGLLFASNTTSCGSMEIFNADDLTETTIPMKLRILNTDAAGNVLEDNSKKYLELTDPAYEKYKKQYYDACYSKMSILGMVTEPRNGYIYFLTSDSYDGIDSNTDADQMNKGFWRFNISAWAEGDDSQPAEHVHSFNSKGIDSKNTALRVRDPYVTVTDSQTDDTSTYIFTSAPDTPYLWRIESSNPENPVYAPTGPSLSPLLTDAYTIKQTRSIAAGTGTVSTPAAYVGGYLTPVVASYDPSATVPLDNSLFSNGHAQTDSMLAYNGKLYAGCYNGAYLIQYDPTKPYNTDPKKGDINPVQLNSAGLKNSYGQARIHALAAGDDKLFFSTIPGDQKLGGIVGYFDLKGFGDESDTKPLAERLVILGELVPNQTLISLVYDTNTKILYGSSSKYGGTNSGVDTDKNGTADHLEDLNTEAMIMVFDVAEWETNQNLETAHKGNFCITEMTLLDDTYTFPKSKPWYIDGIGQDPKSGKLWGVVDQTIFSFSYSSGTFSVTEEIHGRKSVYKPQGNPNWFPRPILFDGNGNVFIQRTGQQVNRYTLDQNNKLTDETSMGKETRCYTLGTDGNLYLIEFHGTNIWRVSTNRVSIAEDLIYVADTEDETSKTKALAAYNELTPDEKAQVGPYYIRKYYLLNGNDCLLNDQPSTLKDILSSVGNDDKVTLLAPQSCNITVNNGVTLDLNAQTVTGNVTVKGGTVNLNGGSINGTVTVNSGSVDLKGGSITGTVNVYDGTVDLKGGSINGNVVATSGTVIDSTDGSGYITGTVQLTEGNGGYLPLKDTAGYRLYHYTAESLNTVWDIDDPKQMNLWFDLEFTNTAAYQLLASGIDTELKIWAEVSVNDKQLPAVYFDEVVKDWANEENSDEDNWALYVGVTNLPDSLITITVIPHLVANGVEVTMDELSVKVGPVSAEVFFAPWLNAPVN